MKKIGLIVNPIAGMGGAVGLKGTDNKVIEAINEGAKPRVTEKVVVALDNIDECYKDSTEIHFYAFCDEMGGDILHKMKIPFHKLKNHNIQSKDIKGNYNGNDFDANWKKELLKTTRNETIESARLMKKHGVDLIIFAGGDGTARDIYEAVGDDFPVIGIPSGVKMQSPVFCKNARASNKVIQYYIEEDRVDYDKREVVDLDEDIYLKGKIKTTHHSYLKTVYQLENYQKAKEPSPVGEKASQILIGYDIEEKINKIYKEEEDVVFIFGPGSTNYQIMKTMGLEGSLLGVDLVKAGNIIAKDVNEEIILGLLNDNKGILILTPIGGQGCLLGRGNQQISEKVLKCIDCKDIWIVATKEKIRGLNFRPLTIDLYDTTLASDLAGYYKVVTGYHESIMIKVCD